MGARQRDWARRETSRMRQLLGGRCSVCGAVEELEFDCKIPMGHDHHSPMEWSQRISFYRAMLAADNLDLKCSPCNSRKGNHGGILSRRLKDKIRERLAAIGWPIPSAL